MWKAIPGFEGKYEVSTSGHVRNSISRKRVHESNRNGYRSVSLCGASRPVHRLVASTYLGDIPIGFHVNHINGIRYDNRITNLEIITAKDNIADGHLRRKKWLPKRLMLPVGQDYENGKRAVLTTNEAARICNFKSSITFRRWAKKLNVRPAYRWAHMSMFYKNHIEAMVLVINSYKEKLAAFYKISRSPIS